MGKAIEAIEVVVLEDDTTVRGDIIDILKHAANIRCVGAFANAEQALDKIAALQPAIVLVDINLPGMSGVEFVVKAVTFLPAAKFIMLTVHDDTSAIFDSLAAGACGYLVKPVRAAQLIAALEDVETGGAPMTSHIARKVVQAFRKPPATNNPAVEHLSEREREVLEFLVNGFLYKEIAAKLSVSYNTVHTYINRIYQKLQVRSRSQAVAKYLKGEN
jgi:DNA-binding NarL/FixJ family response regulator